MKKSYDFSKGKRGAVVPSPGKERITIRLDEDVLEWFRKKAHEAGGGSYQAMINQALRWHMEREEEPLEETFRRVLLEVLPDSVRKTAKRTTTKKKATKRKAAPKK